MWASGVVLYNLLSGNSPFDEMDIPPPPLDCNGELGPMLVEPSSSTAPAAALQPGPVVPVPMPMRFHSYTPEYQWVAVSDAARHAIDKMLIADPRRRPSAAEMLREPWLLPETAQSMASPGLPHSAVAPVPAQEVNRNSAQPMPSTEVTPEVASLASSSYQQGMRNLVWSAKRGREWTEAEAPNSLGSSTGASVGACTVLEVSIEKRLEMR